MKRFKVLVMSSLIFLFILISSCGKKENVPMEAGEGKIILTNCTIIDGTGAAPAEGKSIYISDGIIEKIAEADKGKDREDQQIVLQGYIVLPGFINTHVH